MRNVWRPTAVCAFVALFVSWGYAEPTASPTAWPRTYAGPSGGLLSVCQPQVDAWPNRVRIEAHAAAKLEVDGKKPSYGAIWIEADTRTDQRAGVVSLENVHLTKSSFPELSKSEAARIEKRISAGLADSNPSVPLPAVLASLAKDEAAAKRPALSDEAPQIFYSAKPAILVALDGRALFFPVAKTGLSYVVNTNWNLFSAKSDGRFFLLDGESWLSASSLDGPWGAAGELPPAFSEIPDDGEWQSVRAHVPGKPMAPGEVPQVFVSAKPADIVITDGPPQMATIAGTKLLYVENSPSDLFLDSSTSSFYVLLGGRWFTASALDGAWISAGGRLPADFRKIPPDSPRGSVLVSVPGASQAEEAALQAAVPTIATVDRASATLDVVYAGDPRFEPIEGTELAYAVNTSFAVVRSGDRYYAVSNGIWFVSTAPSGPWRVAVSVPPVIYTIPPMSPLYPVTFVRIYSSSTTTVVVGYTAGYLGTYVWRGAVVFGTGFYYPPYVVRGPVPIYYPYFRTYSAATWYNPATGAYGRGAAVYGPYGGAGAGWAYNPTAGTYARGARAYGPYGGAGYVAAYNPRTGAYGRAETQYGPDGRTTWAQGGNPWTGTYARTEQNRTPYAQWGSSTVTRGGQTTNGAHYSDSRGTVGGFESTTGAKGAGYHTESGKSGGVVDSGSNVYADHNGNVYKHSSDDGWQKYDDGGWQDTQRQNDAGSRSERTQGQARQGGLGGAREDGGGEGSAGLDRDRGARESGLLGGSLGGGGFEQSRGRRFGGGFGGGGFGRGGGRGRR